MDDKNRVKPVSVQEERYEPHQRAQKQKNGRVNCSHHAYVLPGLCCESCQPGRDIGIKILVQSPKFRKIDGFCKREVGEKIEYGKNDTGQIFLYEYKKTRPFQRLIESVLIQDFKE